MKRRGWGSRSVSISRDAVIPSSPTATARPPEQAAAEIRKDDGREIGCAADVSDRDQVDHVGDAAREELGTIGILVTSAGISRTESLVEMTPESWNRIIEVNLTETFHCVQSAIPEMIEARWGRVVLVSSSNAQRGAPRTAHYDSSKGGVIGLGNLASRSTTLRRQ